MLSELEAAISQYLIGSFPDFNLEIDLNPLVNHAGAHLSSDVIFRYARVSKKNPKDIASDLAGFESDDYRVSFVDSYCNVWLKNIPAGEKFYNEKLLNLESDALNIIVPLVRNNSSQSQLCRSVATAFVHFQIAKSAGLNPQLSFVTEGKTYSLSDLSKLDLKWLQSTLSVAKDLPATSLVSKIVSSKLTGAWNVIFLSLGQLSKTEFSEFYRNDILNESKVSYQQATARWSTGLDPELVLAMCTAETSERFLQICWYLARMDKADQLFLAEAFLPQKNNLNWYITTLHSRIAGLRDQIFSKLESAQDSYVVADLADNQQKILLDQYFWEYYVIQAVCAGNVQAVLAMICNHLDSFNVYYNNPIFRLSLESGSLAPVDWEILYGVLERLYSMLGANYGKEMAI